ncbi:MAG: ABC transporter permease subunit, partial [bacterium]
MEFTVLVAKLAEGMWVSVEIFLLTLLFSLPLGLLVALGRMSRNLILKNVIKFYISIMRGTPLILQLMVVYFGPYFIFGLPTPNRFLATIVGFVLNYAAYFAEIYRGGIESIDVGQYEAAQVLGYNKAQTFVRIILPQVIKRILPAVTNEVIT